MKYLRLHYAVGAPHATFFQSFDVLHVQYLSCNLDGTRYLLSGVREPVAVLDHGEFPLNTTQCSGSRS